MLPVTNNEQLLRTYAKGSYRKCFLEISSRPLAIFAVSQAAMQEFLFSILANVFSSLLNDRKFETVMMNPVRLISFDSVMYGKKHLGLYSTRTKKGNSYRMEFLHSAETETGK